VAQNLAHFFFHRAAVPGGPQAQPALQVVVEATDKESWHAINNIMDIDDINDICILQS
jgi:hypothetical protein